MAGFVWTAQSSALSPCPIPGSFEIDGDMAQGTCTPSADDWNTPGLNVASTTQGGTYSASSKDSSDPTGWTSAGHTPDKTDFATAYAFSRVVGGHFYVFVAWERTSTTGTQGYAIEIDNAAARTANDGTPQPNRDSGGAVFFVSSQGSSAPAFDSACQFTSHTDYGNTCTSSSASFTGAINTASITDTIAGGTVPAGGFFEVALDVTALTGIVPSCPGASAASVYLRSVTGQVSNGNLKGYLAPLTVAPDSTCVTPTITTTATPGNSTIDGLQAVAPGTSQHDVVQVGTVGTPGVGTVAFFLCQPNEVTSGQGCTTGGTQIGSAVPLNGTGGGTSASTTNTNTPGHYCWRAEFTPSADDHNYLPAAETNDNTECFDVVHGTPTIATQIAVTGDHAPGLGFTTLGDTATLSNVQGDIDGQSVAFNLYGPFTTLPAPCPGNAIPVFTTSGTLSGNSATTAQTFQPTEAGTYVWIASYGGDTINGSATGTCNDANESVTIVGAHIDVAKAANPPGPVSAGESIGFDITVSNAGAVPAQNVTVTDNLPAGAHNISGGDLTWSLNPAYQGCSISGAAGSQVLSCSFQQVDATTTLTAIHITATTTQNDCGVVQNRASVQTTNGTGGDSDLATVTVQCASLTLTKTADAATVSAGSPFGFTVTASNTGAGSASGVNLNDPLPAGSGVSWQIDGAHTSGPLTCSILGTAPSQTLSCTGTLAAGATEIVHVFSSTSFASCATYVNIASLSATNVTGVLHDDASTTVLCPDVTFTKTADDTVVAAGSPIGFTVSATNNGQGAATSVSINDPLPAGSGVNWAISPAYAGPGTCSITGAVGSQVLSCSFGNLASGASASVHVQSATSFASCQAYPNDATIEVGNEPDVPNAHATTTVDCPALSITKVADATTVDAGSQIGFVITVTNSSAAGTATASGLALSDPLPAGSGVDWSVAGTTGTGSCQITGAVGAQTLSCSAATFAAGASLAVHITSPTTFDSCQLYPNDAEVHASNHPSIHGTASLTVQCPDLSVTKTADDAVVSAGDQIGFTITAHNGGPGTATAATIADDLPGGSGVDWSISPAYDGPGTCDITGTAPQHLACDFGPLASGASATVHVVSATVFASCGVYNNTATVDAGNSPAVESRQASTEVDCPNPGLTKTADADTVDAGDSIGFTITASNSDAEGTGIARDVVINDPLPSGPGISWHVDAGPDNCAITTDPQSQVQTLSCTPVDLAPGEAEVVHVTSGTDFTSCGQYNNQAVMTLTNGPLALAELAVATDANPVIFTAEATVQVNCPTLAVAKVADASAVNSGEDIGFTIHATNAGPGTAFAAVIQDALPAHPGAHWTISPDYTGPGTCAIAGADGAQVLTCALGDFPEGGDATVHVTATTTADSCGDFPNTVNLASGNAPTVSASATTTVNCAGVSPETPTPTPPPPLAATGAGPINGEFGWAFGLIAAGMLLMVLGRKRRLGRQH